MWSAWRRRSLVTELTGCSTDLRPASTHEADRRSILCRYELNLLLEGVCGGSLRGSDVFLSSFFIVWLGVLRGVCGALGVLLSSSESERVMQGLETEREAEGEGDAGGLRAAGGKRYRKEFKKKKRIISSFGHRLIVKIPSVLGTLMRFRLIHHRPSTLFWQQP